MVRPVFQRAPSRTNTVDDVDERNTSFLRNLQSSHAYSPETSLQPDTDMLDLSEENTSGVPHTGAHSNSKPQRRVRAPSDDVKAVESPPLGKRRYSARSQAEDLNTLMPIIKKKPSHFRSQRRREQCRINQIRYRMRQLNHEKLGEVGARPTTRHSRAGAAARSASSTATSRTSGAS